VAGSVEVMAAGLARGSAEEMTVAGSEAGSEVAGLAGPGSVAEKAAGLPAESVEKVAGSEAGSAVAGWAVGSEAGSAVASSEVDS